jgi:[ribosomal protein S5]-alanine N-acetyltransferase
MFEALTVVIAYAFNDMGLHRIMANYIPTNERSGRLLRRLGFVVEGYARDYLFLAGNWQDHILTSLINPAKSATES